MNKKYEELVYDWPYLFQKSPDFEINVGEGWYAIVDSVCEVLYGDTELASAGLAQALSLDPADQEKTNGWQELLDKEIEKMPIITSIHQQHGKLQFYVDGDASHMSVDIMSIIYFAELLSGKTCEICGGHATQVHYAGFFMRTLCRQHHIG